MDPEEMRAGLLRYLAEVGCSCSPDIEIEEAPGALLVWIGHADDCAIEKPDVELSANAAVHAARWN